jgi:hypothetical protein
LASFLSGLPHTYTLVETSDVEKIKKIINSTDFGGASVTIPMKEVVQPLLSRLTEAATHIGAVNTIFRDPATGDLVGDNTDWIGMRDCILDSWTNSMRDQRFGGRGGGGVVGGSVSIGTRTPPSSPASLPFAPSSSPASRAPPSPSAATHSPPFSPSRSDISNNTSNTSVLTSERDGGGKSLILDDIILFFSTFDTHY